ncbi:unnamed protein product, partial [Polarella glacialis]
MDPAAAGALLSALESPQRDERLQALDQLRSLSADPSGCLDRRRLASAICACLSEESVEVCCRCATVAPEVLEWLQKDSCTSSLAPSTFFSRDGSTARDEEIGRALHLLAENLGDDRDAVRAATQQGLASYASGGAERLVASLRLVADFGISHPSSWRVRLHSILSVQQLVGSSSGASLADVDLSWLLECLV